MSGVSINGNLRKWDLYKREVVVLNIPRVTIPIRSGIYKRGGREWTNPDIICINDTAFLINLLESSTEQIYSMALFTENYRC